MKTAGLIAALIATAAAGAPARADDVPPEWHPMAAAVRVMRAFTGGSGTITVESNFSAKSDDGIAFRRSEDQPCTIIAMDRRRRLFFQIKIDKLYDPWTLQVFPFDHGRDYVKVQAASGGACRWATPSDQKCFSEISLPAQAGATDRALKYLANNVCQMPERPPF